jgi:hypothetical protein
MLTPDVRFEGFGPTDWSRLLSLFRVEPAQLAVPDGSPRGGLVLVHDGGRVRKALHTLDGRVDPHVIPWPRPLADVAHDQKVLWAWALHAGALEELMERLGARVRRGDDALTQLLLGFGAFRELLEEGAIESWPRRLRNVPIPTRPVVDRAIDAVLPAGKSALLALYDRGELWTALIVRRATSSPARFDAIVGPADIRREAGVLSGEFRRDYRHIASAVEARWGSLALGLHADVPRFRQLIAHAKPGDWARAVALRDVVLRPLPRVLALPLGVDATRGATELAQRLAKQIDPVGIVSPMLSFLGKALPDRPEGSQSFEPLSILRRLLQPE